MDSFELSEAVVSQLKDAYSNADIRVTDVVVGQNLVLIEITRVSDDERFVGVAHRPPVAFPSTQTIVDFDGFALAQWAVDPLADVSFDERAARCVGVATMNALSVPLIDWVRGDPMELISSDVSVVATVGLFNPALRKFGAKDVRVIEREPRDPDCIDAPDSVAVETYLPGDVDTAFDGVEVLFITGSAGVYGGLERYVSAATDIPTVVVIGATASFLPGPLFDAGVSMVAGARVTTPETVKSGILAGGCASDLHQLGLEKVFVTASENLPGIEVLSTKQ